MSGWEPIKTAPKDGTKILCYASGIDEGEPWENYAVVWWEPNGYWSSGPCFVDGYNPSGGTHWMPLSPPPI